MRKTGLYEQLGAVRYFIPYPLPPANPPLQLDSATTELYGEAMLQLGKLNGVIDSIPDPTRFVKAYVIKEALLSSAIEGIHTTLLDVYTQPLLEAPPTKETQLVINYIRALDAAVDLVQEQGLPITSRVLFTAHALLMHNGQGDKADPGHYRKQTVKVGNLIPAPPQQVPGLMDQLEHFINMNTTIAPLVKAGLAHVQFETIHPFLDGNGRIGRLLIVLMLLESQLLKKPILYPSYYFKKHRLEYYRYLDRVRTHGDFEGWIAFYLTALKESSIDAYRRAKQIKHLQAELTTLITSRSAPSPTKQNQLEALALLFNWPIINTTTLSKKLDMSYNSAKKILEAFIQLGIVEPQPQKKRGKLFMFLQYLKILEDD